MSMKNIAAIVVLYEPELSKLLKLHERLLPQVTKIYFVDNSEEFNLPAILHLFDNVVHIDMHGNKGIAAAQNAGASMAFMHDADDIILFDQDSLPEPEMIQKLLNSRIHAQQNGHLVAAVGPSHLDKRSNCVRNFISTGRVFVKKIKPSDNYCLPSFLTASGSLISKDAWQTVGGQRNDFFIDCVDLEWGFRALHHGYVLVGVGDAILEHELGDEHISICGKKLINHSPLRHYYFYRNFYYSLRLSYIPASWKIHVVIKSTLQLLIFSLANKRGWLHAKMITTGIIHGMLGKMGKFSH
jgi:Predicted glycosyltransferases